MPESERKSAPNLVIILLTIFGLSTLQAGNSGSSPKVEPPLSEAGPKATAPSGRHEPEGKGEGQILKPLVDHFVGAGGGSPTIAEVLKLTERGEDRGLHCLIATVPDPVQSTNSHRFDEWLGAIQQACESDGFVLDGFRLPWKPASAPPAPQPEGGPAQGRLVRALQELTGQAPTPVSVRDPGVLLYRSLATANFDARQLLLVFLVPETPTRGIDKGVLLESFKLSARWDVRNRREDNTSKSYNILGPTFSGSQLSLEQSLAAWCVREPGPHSFEIITGSATAIERPRLKMCVLPNKVSFSATVHMSEALLGAALGFMGQEDGVALLTERDTALGVSSGNKYGGNRAKIVVYPFPYQISKLRASYEKNGLLNDKQSRALGSTERLTIPFEVTGEPTDIPATQTPAFTTAVEELTLNQIFADLRRRDIRKVGIIATDPLDIVFLARQLGRFCPDVQLFTTQSHLLFTHPQHVAELRGMLVASTYPLYPLNQLWSYSYKGDMSHAFFSGDTVQGTYNAAVAHLHQIGNPDVLPRFLEYGTPFDPPGSYKQGTEGWAWGVKLRKPPIWLSVVGNHGLYPVATVEPTDPSDEAYVFAHSQKEEEYQSIPLATPTEFDEEGISWRRVRDWFRPSLPRFWLFVFWGLTLACAALTAVNLMIFRWAIGDRQVDCETMRIGPIPTVALAQFLNCCRGNDTARGGACRGPGLLLTIALFLLGIVYLTVSYPVLEVSWNVPWYPTDIGYGEFWIALAAYATTCAMAVSLVLSVFGWVVIGRGIKISPGFNLIKSRVALVLCVAILVVPVGRVWSALSSGGAAHSFATIEGAQRDALFRLSRSAAIPSGVSPVLSILLLGAAGLAWVHAQLRRRFIRDQYSPKVESFIPPDNSSGDWKTLLAVSDRHRRFEEILGSDWEVPSSGAGGWRSRWFGEIVATPVVRLLRDNAAVSLVIALFSAFFLLPVLSRSIGWHGKLPDGSFLGWVAGVLFCVLFVLITFHLLQVIALWRNVQAMMNLILRLPLTSALDRIPPRVANWFKEPPGSGNRRFELIRRQSLALAALSEGDRCAVRRELSEALERNIPFDRWTDLVKSLKVVERHNIDAIRDQLLVLVVEYWRPLPVGAAFADAHADVSRTGPADDKVPGELRNIALAIAKDPLDAPGSPRRLPEWIRLAEDLLALLLMRWVAASFAQVWNLFGFLAAGAMALLLAINAYPYPFQDRLMLGIGLLIVVLVATILVIVVGFNRDEMINRISNTSPNRLKIDQHLLGILATYVVPLVGVLAAISFDASDTLRTLFDPILRHFR